VDSPHYGPVHSSREELCDLSDGTGDHGRHWVDQSILMEDLGGGAYVNIATRPAEFCTKTHKAQYWSLDLTDGVCDLAALADVLGAAGVPILTLYRERQGFRECVRWSFILVWGK
jgi:hypothetical protein